MPVKKQPSTPIVKPPPTPTVTRRAPSGAGYVVPQSMLAPQITNAVPQGWQLVTTPMQNLAQFGLPNTGSRTTGNTSWPTNTIYMATGQSPVRTNAAGLRINPSRPFDVAGILSHELGHIEAASHNLISAGLASGQRAGRITPGVIGAIILSRLGALFNPAARNAPLGPENYYAEAAANRYAPRR